jgi:hypothetical protein
VAELPLVCGDRGRLGAKDAPKNLRLDPVEEGVGVAMRLVGADIGRGPPRDLQRAPQARLDGVLESREALPA